MLEFSNAMSTISAMGSLSASNTVRIYPWITYYSEIISKGAFLKSYTLIYVCIKSLINIINVYTDIEKEANENKNAPSKRISLQS